MVICLPSIVMSPFFFIVIVAEPVFSTISSPADDRDLLADLQRLVLADVGGAILADRGRLVAAHRDLPGHRPP